MTGGVAVTRREVWLSRDLRCGCHVTWRVVVTRLGVWLSRDVGCGCHVTWGVGVTRRGVWLSHNVGRTGLKKGTGEAGGEARRRRGPVGSNPAGLTVHHRIGHDERHRRTQHFLEATLRK